MQQRCVMPQQMAGLFCKSHLSVFSTLIFQHAVAFLLLTHSCGGQPQPIGAKVGDDITLPCHMKPARDAADEMLEWSRPDLNPRFVHVRRSGEDRLVDQNPSYEGRTSVSINRVKQGDVSLNLSKVKLSDEGTYRCFVPALNTDSSVQLVVVVSGAVIDITKVSSGVLQCESPGWYPEPEVLWLDGEGHVLSAGPAETVRGPDDLYTVSSRVTVEKRHSNSFTCRVQQNHINQSRETHIHVPDDFFQLQSSCGVPIITALSVSLAVCILIILLFLFFVWKQKQNKNKTKRDRGLEAEMKGLKGEEEKKSKHLKPKKRLELQLQEEPRRREEAESEVQTLKEELETKKNQLETLQRNSKHNPMYLLVGGHDNQMENLGSNNMEGKEEKKSKHLEDKEQVNLQWKQTNEELKEAKCQLRSKKEEISQLKRDLEKQLCEEKKKEEEAERDLKELMTKNIEFEKKLQDERNKRERAEKDVKILKDQETELQKKLQDERIKRERAEKEAKRVM